MARMAPFDRCKSMSLEVKVVDVDQLIAKAGGLTERADVLRENNGAYQPSPTPAVIQVPPNAAAVRKVRSPYHA